MSGFNEKQLKMLVTKAMFDEIDKKQAELIKFGNQAMIDDITARQATDTNLLSRSIGVKTERLENIYRISYFIETNPYNYKNTTSASYLRDKPPSTPAPNYNPPSQLKDTKYSAIQVIWGLGIHRKKGARNFPLVAMKKTIKKYFGNV